MDENLFDAFSLLYVRNQKYMHKLFGMICAECGLNCSAVICLTIIMRYPNGVSAGELSKIGCVDKALISRTLKELTEKGYVCRNPEDKDMARGFRIILGSRGKELSERFESLVYGISRYITENVSAQELSAYYEISERISENIRELTKKDIKSLLELP